MKKVTIISGAQGTGKTLKAREIAQGKRVHEAMGLTLREAVASMPVDTEVIIIDLNLASDILAAIRAEYTSLRIPYTEKLRSVKIPDLIITTCISVEFIEQIQATEILKLTQTIK